MPTLFPLAGAPSLANPLWYKVGMPFEDIWISAWREAGPQAAKIRSHLERTFPGQVLKAYQPNQAMSPDEVFAMVKACKVAIIIIDREWTTRPNPHRRWFDNRRHTVRLAIGTALKRQQLHVIPVVLPGASIPIGLPADLSALGQKNPVAIRDGFFEEDVERLIRRVAELVPPRPVPPAGGPEPPGFDVFLSYNRADKHAVTAIARSLRQHNIQPWLDMEQLPPGVPFDTVIEGVIEQIGSAAVFFGRAGLGPWQTPEVRALLGELVDRRCPVIPVILPDCGANPKMPLLLRGIEWVDFRPPEPDPIERLIWGITQKRTPHHS